MWPENRKETKSEKITRTETRFNFKNHLHKHRSYDVHNVEEEDNETSDRKVTNCSP